MEQKKHELKIELTPDVATGHYSNMAMLAHSPQEFYLDFVAIAPNMPQAKVVSRIIMTPENAKNLLAALHDNVSKYEKTFGEITRKVAKGAPANGNDIPNPFQA